MRGNLLDTNTILLAMSSPEVLSEAVHEAILTGPNVLSVVSYWHVALQSAECRLHVGDPRAWWNDALEQLAATPLALRPEHVGGVVGLAPLHQDPFDRMLVAQAKVEGLTQVTTDIMMARYGSVGLRVVR